VDSHVGVGEFKKPVNSPVFLSSAASGHCIVPGTPCSANISSPSGTFPGNPHDYVWNKVCVQGAEIHGVRIRDSCLKSSCC